MRLGANNAVATFEDGEPQHGGREGGHSVWWSWTAPSTGVSTAGSSFNTTLAVYRGDSLTALSLVGQNDNAGRSTSSLVRFAALAGETYRIAVDGVGGAAGEIVLSIKYDNSADYAALVRRVGDGALTGYASAKISGSQQYTGKLVMEGIRYSFRGKLDPAAATSHPLKGKKAPTLTLTLSANPRTGTDSVAGIVQGNSGTHEFTFLRALAPSDLVQDAVGRYTAALDAKVNAPEFPGGIGFASFSLNRTGAVRMKGQLGDGQAFSAGGPVDLNSQLALFAEPYKGAGSIGGYITFDQNAATPTALGQLEWKKAQVLRSKTYPAGFSKFTEFRGARYVRPRRGAPALGFSAGLVKFLGGDVAFSPTEQSVTISSLNKIISTGHLPKFSAAIDTRTGLWHGTFNAGAGGPKLSFDGAMLPSENRAIGVFVGAQQTGSVTLAPAP